MELSRRQTLTVLAITAATALPASTAKAATQPVFTDLGVAPNSDIGFTAQVACAVPVTSVTARLSDQLGTEVARYQLRLFNGSDPTNGLWMTGPLTGIDLGNYTMSWEATSRDGGVGTARSEAFVWLFPEITTAVTPPKVGPAQRTVTVSGTLTGRHPVTRSVVPIAGMPLILEADYWESGIPNPSPLMLTSAADGSFTGQFTLVGVTFLSLRTNAPGRETLVEDRTFLIPAVLADEIPVRITLNADATHVDFGGSSTVDGLLEHFYQDQWRPMPGHALTVGFQVFQGPDAGPPSQVITDDQGRFRATMTPPAYGCWSVTFPKEPFYRATTVSSPLVYVRQPVDLRDVAIARVTKPGGGGMWELSGLMSDSWSSPTVAVQFRATSVSAWREIGRVVATPAGTPWWHFKAGFTPPTAGQVRAYSAATDTRQEAASKVFVVAVGRAGTAVQQAPGAQQSPHLVTAPERPAHD